jgi:hypothetical protein
MMDLMFGSLKAFWSFWYRYCRTGAPRALTGLGLEGGAPSAMAMIAVPDEGDAMIAGTILYYYYPL